jgi:putative DNA primase/helicase
MPNSSDQETQLSATAGANGSAVSSHAGTGLRVMGLPPLNTLEDFEAAARINFRFVLKNEITEGDLSASLWEKAEACGLLNFHDVDTIQAHLVAGYAAAKIEARKSNDKLDAKASEATDNTEDALARLFTQRYGEDLRYVAAWGRWLEWADTHWRSEPTLKVYDFARKIVREVASARANPTQQAKIASAATVAAIERLARADRQHAAKVDIWDADPWSLNTPGGLVDLRAGKIAAHDRTDYNTKITTATPRGDCPGWLTFLAKVTGGDIELQAYLRRVMGYCLTGITSEHALFFLYGTGANGKSVLLNIWSTILNDYAAVAPMDMFMAAKGEQHPTDMAGLRGARLVTATETDQGRRWAESKLKALTGGDKITARFMRQDFFEFVPQFKLTVAGNHKPSIRNVDEAMRRRLRLIPFAVTIPSHLRDTKLTEKLLAERDGILAWAVEGCREWQRNGLRPPHAVSSATDEYFKGEDAVGRWLDEACELSPNRTETIATLYAAWKSWAELNGEFFGSAKRFSDELSKHGFERDRDKHARGFRGLCLRRDTKTEIDR